MKTVGIIGLGSFGTLLAKKLDAHCKVLAYSRSQPKNKWAASLDEIAKADYIIPAIPIDAYESVLKKIKPSISKDAVIVDVSSIKQKPIELIKKHLPGQAIVATHPLFGPESAGESLKSHTLVVCPEVSDNDALSKIEKFASQLKLKVVRMSVEEHDQEMAVVQGLTFFVAKVLHSTGIHHQKLETPSFKRLLYLAELETHHSDDLFKTIQLGNAKTAAVRQKFIKIADKLNQSLDNK